MIRDLTAFKVWLSLCGAEILAPTNEWEVLRVRTAKGVLVAHRNRKGHQKWPDGLVRLAEKYNSGEYPALARSRRRLPSKLRQRFPTLVKRDGPSCFYCGTRVPEPGEPCATRLEPTIEHLVPRAHGGPNHLSNCFLAHFGCNQEAGSLSAPEKIKIRERLRG